MHPEPQIRYKDIKLADRIEIVTDDTKPDKIEIYMLNFDGDRIEGGEFDKDLFMSCVLQFYTVNY